MVSLWHPFVLILHSALSVLQEDVVVDFLFRYRKYLLIKENYIHFEFLATTVSTSAQ